MKKFLAVMKNILMAIILGGIFGNLFCIWEYLPEITPFVSNFTLGILLITAASCVSFYFLFMRRGRTIYALVFIPSEYYVGVLSAFYFWRKIFADTEGPFFAGIGIAMYMMLSLIMCTLFILVTELIRFRKKIVTELIRFGKWLKEGEREIAEAELIQTEEGGEVTRQYFYDYPNSTWKSEETGYTLIVPDEKELEDDCKAEIWVEQEGNRELYEMYEPLYSSSGVGEICYNPKQECEETDFGKYLNFTIYIYEQDNNLYMELLNFDAGKDYPDKINKYFTRYSKIIFKRVK